MMNDPEECEEEASAGALDEESFARKGDGRRGWWGKRLMVIICLVAVVYLVGPRIGYSEIARREASGVPNEVSELDDYLEKSEAKFSDIVEGTEKVIRWQSGQEGEQTEFSVVYLHGFSGSHPTLAPAMDLVADGLGAHLFCTRFAGHGRKEPNGKPEGFGKAMGEASLQDWVDDTVEALAIGRVLGKKVVVIANSTAAPIASWLSSQGDAPDFFIMWSPNFGVEEWAGRILLGPWGEEFLAMQWGDTYSYKEENIYGADHRKYATTIYPHKAFIPMAAAIKLGREANLAKVSCPTLCLYSKGDQVVSPAKIERYFNEFGHPGNQLLEITTVTHREKHVLAGDLMSPESTGEVVEATLAFIREEVARGK